MEKGELFRRNIPEVCFSKRLQSVNFTPHSVINCIFEDCEQHLYRQSHQSYPTFSKIFIQNYAIVMHIIIRIICKLKHDSFCLHLIKLNNHPREAKSKEFFQ